MDPTNQRSHVLVVCQDETAGRRLTRWVNATGSGVVCLHNAEALLMGDGEDDSIDVLVTDLDAGQPENRVLIRRLASGDLFPDVPQIHLLRDPAFRDQLLAWNPEMAAVSMPSPPDSNEFQARIRLAREVGSLRRDLALTSIQDGMTGVYNRRYFLSRLDQEFSRATRYRTPLSLILADIDHLRTINTRFGQSAGDAAIRSVSELLCRCGRKRRHRGPASGTECFGVILPGTRHRGAAVSGQQDPERCGDENRPGVGT